MLSCFQKAKGWTGGVDTWRNFGIAYIRANWLCPIIASIELLCFCVNEYKRTGLAVQYPGGSTSELFGFGIVT